MLERGCREGPLRMRQQRRKWNDGREETEVPTGDGLAKVTWQEGTAR